MYRPLLLIACCLAHPVTAQFVESFDQPVTTGHSLNNWAAITGDGHAELRLLPGEGYATLAVDARPDTLGVWYAFIQKDVAPALDLRRLARRGHELQLSARVRPRQGPRRVNLYLSQRRPGSDDHHGYLLEYDLPEADRWYELRLTSRDFAYHPGDQIFAQISMMDWGLDRYQLDVDELRVEVVKSPPTVPMAQELVRAADPPAVAVRYWPPLRPAADYDHSVPVADDALVDARFPDRNYNDWQRQGADAVALLTLDATLTPVLRWDLSALRGQQVVGEGQLEFYVESLWSGREPDPKMVDEVGKVRVTELIGGATSWQEADVTWRKLSEGKTFDEVVNPQMVADVFADPTAGRPTVVPISQPVLQRLIDGRTSGLALRPLGAMVAAVYAHEAAGGKYAARLRFNVRK